MEFQKYNVKEKKKRKRERKGERVIKPVITLLSKNGY